MAKYSGKPVTVNKPINDIYSRLNNLSAFQQRIDELPEEARQKLGEVTFTDDRITINAPAVGPLTFVVAERVEPTLLRLSAENSPVPFNIILNMAEKGEELTEISTDLDVEIPMMLRPLVGGKMQEAADKISETFSNLFGMH